MRWSQTSRTLLKRRMQVVKRGGYLDLISCMRDIVSKNDIIVVEGCIGAGKSTLCQGYDNSSLYRIYYEPSTTTFFDLDAADYILKFQLDMLETRAIELQYHNTLKHKIIFDTGIWQDYAFAKNTLNQREWEKYLQTFYLAYPNAYATFFEKPPTPFKKRLFINTTDQQSYTNVRLRSQIVGEHMTEDFEWIKRSNNHLRKFTMPHADYVFHLKIPRKRKHSTTCTPPYWLRSGRGTQGRDLPGGITSTLQKNI